MSPSAKPQTRLEVSRWIDADVRRLFEAWIRPELMRRWFCPQDLVVDSAEADARPGGRYRISMKDPVRGKIFTTTGTYTEITPHKKIAFTWMFDQPGQAESLVTVTFEERSGGTLVHVLHERYADIEGENTHKQGWTSALEHLEIRIAEPLPEGLAEREIVIQREIAAPRGRVFEAMTDPEQVVKWWGPDGFTNTTHEREFRPGGVWSHTMHGPDGTDYPNRSIFVEVTPPERVVYRHAGGVKERGGACFLGIWTFEERGDKTLVTIRLRFGSSEEKDHVIKAYQALEGGKQTLARLEEHLLSRGLVDAGREDLVIRRVFNAPRERVWKAWTDPDLMRRWWGPRSFEAPFVKIDFRTGGRWHYCMRAAEGPEVWRKGIWCTGVYLEIVPLEKIVMTDCFADEQGNVVRAAAYGMGEEVPEEMLVTVTFQDYPGGKTLMTLRHQRLPDSHRRDAGFGWNESFDKLAESLTA